MSTYREIEERLPGNSGVKSFLVIYSKKGKKHENEYFFRFKSTEVFYFFATNYQVLSIFFTVLYNCVNVFVDGSRIFSIYTGNNNLK